ncbi:hypothetical protein [Alteromonas flava]|uniref:hypothetical protein n=1 Tax=Alteromonas flava TaxID=2048003 RepID=UPI000F6029ED|nr:hypothetical protein [Alteromonas flava]
MSLLTYSFIGLLAYWLIGLLAYWLIGLLAYWLIGVLAYWRIGVLQQGIFLLSAPLHSGDNTKTTWLTHFKMLSVVTLDDTQLAACTLVSGTSGRAVRWLVAGFTLGFGGLIYALVIAKPEVPMVIKSICLGLFGFAVFALLLSGRLKRGWPNILHDNQYLYVVYDPAKSEFLKIPFAAIAGCKKKMLYPNTMAVSVEFKPECLTENCDALLKNAIFPAQGAVHIYSALNSRNRIITQISALTEVSAK